MEGRFICGKQPEAGTSARVQSGHDAEPTPCEGREGEPCAPAARTPKGTESGQPQQLDYTGKRNPVPWTGEF